MTYEVRKVPGPSTEWVAEALDAQGVAVVAIFVGVNARERAEEYAAWKNSSTGIPGQR
jgi:hypothetical protein